MIRKIRLLYILLALLVLTGGGFFVWQKFTKTSGLKTQADIPFGPSPNYPRVEKFEVPILMYHYIRNAEGETELGKSLSVSPGNFASQIKYLKDDGYETVLLADIGDPQRKALSRVYFEKKKPIVFTFDDGYEDAYSQAWPVLKKYSFTGTFFIIRDYVGKEGRLSWSQIEEMKKAGMEIGSHSLSHPDLTKLSPEEARRQIFDSRDETNVFCYPAGKYDGTILQLVKEAGYIAAVTTKIGIARESSSMLELPRVRVEDTSPEVLMDKISYASEQ